LKARGIGFGLLPGRRRDPGFDGLHFLDTRFDPLFGGFQQIPRECRFRRARFEFLPRDCNRSRIARSEADTGWVCSG